MNNSKISSSPPGEITTQNTFQESFGFVDCPVNAITSPPRKKVIRVKKEKFEVVLIVIRNVGDIVLITFKFFERFVL